MRDWIHRVHRRNPIRREEDSQPTKNEIMFKGVPFEYRDRLGDDEEKLELIEVWLYHPDIMSRIGEYCLFRDRIFKITELGLVPYHAGE